MIALIIRPLLGWDEICRFWGKGGLVSLSSRIAHDCGDCRQVTRDCRRREADFFIWLVAVDFQQLFEGQVFCASDFA